MKKIIIFILTSLFSNIFSMEEDSNMAIGQDSTKNELELSNLQDEVLIPILSEFESYVNQIKGANNIFEFYKFFDQEKNTELSNIRLNGKLFNIIIANIYLKRINAKFEKLKSKAIADCHNKSKEDLNKELQDILNPGMSLEEEKLKQGCTLILAGADVDTQNQTGWTALMCAVNKGYIEIVKLLLDKNVDIDLQNKAGWTALMVAARRGHNEIVKLLLDKNANIDLQDCADCTALMCAVRSGCIEMIKLLLDKNANTDIQNMTGWTALMLAVNLGYNEIVKLLLDKNANIDIQNNRGQKALIIAENKGYNEVVDLLRSKNS